MAIDRARTGAGRPKGSKNKTRPFNRKKYTDSELSALLKNKETPLEFLISIYTDEKQPVDRRMDAAKACLPYMHKKMPQVIEPSAESRAPLKFTIHYGLPKGDDSA
jgi:hypothetical protein